MKPWKPPQPQKRNISDALPCHRADVFYVGIREHFAPHDAAQHERIVGHLHVFGEIAK